MSRPATQWMHPGWVLIDVETTGLDPARHSMVEFSAMKWNGQRLDLVFRPRIGSEIDMAAVAVWGGDLALPNALDELESRDTSYGAAVHQIVEFLTDCQTIAGLNVGSFDLLFIESAYEYQAAIEGSKLRCPLRHRTVDLHTFAVIYAQMLGETPPAGGYSADAIGRLIKIDPERRPHSSRRGVDWECAAFAKINNLQMVVTESLRQMPIHPLEYVPERREIL
jgi:hypothetical protein